MEEAPHPVRVPAGRVALDGDLGVPDDAVGVVVFAHGSGSSRMSPRNRAVAARLREAGLGTLLMDLLTSREEAVDAQTRHLRFDIGFLASRLVHALEWLHEVEATDGLPVGLFGSSTGAAAALAASVRRPGAAQAIVSRGGRPDLAGPALPRVEAPTLLIVGGRDPEVLELNEEAMVHLRAPKALEVVEGATHLFQEPGALDRVADLAAEWFVAHLRAGGRAVEREA